MKTKSWHLNRRELLKGGGIALALPLLNGMSLAAPSKTHPKRMLVSYFSYGAYMPNGQHGIPNPEKPHNEWSWWPCRHVCDVLEAANFRKRAQNFQVELRKHLGAHCHDHCADRIQHEYHDDDEVARY